MVRPIYMPLSHDHETAKLVAFIVAQDEAEGTVTLAFSTLNLLQICDFLQQIFQIFLCLRGKVPILFSNLIKSLDIAALVE